MMHFAALSTAGSRINLPALCRRRYEHSPRDCPGMAKGLPRCAYRVRVAGCLDATQQRVAVKLFVRWSMLQPYLFQVDLKFLGNQHWDRGVGTLAHFNVGHGQHYLTIASNADERIGRESI